MNIIHLVLCQGHFRTSFILNYLILTPSGHNLIVDCRGGVQMLTPTYESIDDLMHNGVYWYYTTFRCDNFGQNDVIFHVTS